MRTFFSAIKTVLQERRYFLMVLLFSPAVFFVFILIPVITIPGNDFVFQLSIFRIQDYLLMLLLAILVGLNFSMNIYAWKKKQVVASGVTAGFGGAFASIVGTASCASCLASLFGIMGLGIGSVAFVLKYQTIFLLGAIALVIISLYFTSRKVNKHCASCQ